MAIAFVHGVGANTKTLTPAAVTAGNLLVVSYVDTTGAVSGISDTANNSWKVAQVGSAVAGSVCPWVWYAVANSSATITITVVDSGTNFGIACVEYSGATAVGATSILIEVLSGTTAVSAGPITVNGALYIACVFSTGAYTSTSGSTLRTSGGVRILMGDNLTATGAFTETGTLGSAPSGFSVPFLIMSFGAPVFTISGSAGTAGATVSWTGTSSGSTTADGSGNYSITGLSPGTYTLVASKTGFKFSPATQPETITNANISGVNFTATAATSRSTRSK